MRRTGSGAEVSREFFAFIDAYREHGGPVTDRDLEDVVMFLRLRRRDLIRRTAALGVPIEHPYAQNLSPHFPRDDGEQRHSLTAQVQH